uniref:Glutathione-disulfide reductase n=1 Tax=Parascaris univalens TaxID=6257 RepID=A0A915AQF6_PARUN
MVLPLLLYSSDQSFSFYFKNSLPISCIGMDVCYRYRTLIQTPSQGD